MKSLNLHGIFPALATPYQPDEGLDVEALRRLVLHLLPDVDGFLVNGTTGDFPLLTAEERRRAVEAVVESVAGRKLVIAGTGAIATHEAIAHTQAARDAGADVALIIAPYYLRPSAAGLYRHYADIAAAVPDFPILLYNFPQLVGQYIPASVIQALHKECPNIIGMKDTSGDLAYMASVIEILGPTFSVIVGQGTVVLPALSLGAVGAILACANLIPKQWRAVYQAFQRGDYEAARAGQLQAQKVSRLVGKAGSLTVRAGLEMQGLPIGPARRPLTIEGQLTPEDLETLRQALREMSQP